MNKERKIIFECRVGSHLYGTNRPESDEDFLGVFLPSTEDLLSLGNCPSEWTMNEKLSDGPRNAKGDTDRKYFSLQKFLKLCGEGQSGAIELLFAPSNMIVKYTHEWEYILEHRDIFISKGSILPFVGFATAQMYKACVKGENLKMLRQLIENIESITKAFPDKKYKTVEEEVSAIWSSPNEGMFFGIRLPCVKTTYTYEDKTMEMECIQVVGRKFEFTQKIKDVLSKLKGLEGRYGTRSEAALENGYDFKSMCHAYRLLYQAEELMATGKISLPRPKNEAIFLTIIREGKYEADYFQEIETMITKLNQIKETSHLPYDCDFGKINELCKEMLFEHLFEEEYGL